MQRRIVSILNRMDMDTFMYDVPEIARESALCRSKVLQQAEELWMQAKCSGVRPLRPFWFT